MSDARQFVVTGRGFYFTIIGENDVSVADSDRIWGSYERFIFTREEGHWSLSATEKYPDHSTSLKFFEDVRAILQREIARDYEGDFMVDPIRWRAAA